MARGLNVDLVVEAAVAIADAEGLAAVSMATVAKRCGFTTMSLYRHVASKDELVWRMLDRALGPAPELVFDGWRDGLSQWAHTFMAMLRAHPWGVDIPINGTLPTHAQLSWLNRGLEVLDGTGLEDGEGADLVLLVNGYVFWASRLETSLAAAPPQPLVPPQHDLSEFPYVQRALAAGQFEDDMSPDENFQSGLDRVLDGIGVLIARRGPVG
ncbi:TetR/AcrR family transcriptional regulator [Solirubrobacter phytolaccae]|uniref:TetR/AcrR family transcriptional regulator n=1 Tax=Solirubrobacter phytolaccae TaxID=1404360 RepID=A0A9X3N634_9ACTN|nr:TetR/AcrR family transcriptional regulator [Solirubrobacter phytolaccae]MDA0180448.1 TetR/AcrR family transcriptional regulator [Solirubrobacter phytolaccae]